MVGYDSDEFIAKAGGRYRFVALIQHRMRELQRGLAPLVEQRSTYLETAIEELREGKIWLASGQEAEKLHEERAEKIAEPEKSEKPETPPKVE